MIVCYFQRRSAHDTELLRTALRHGLKPIKLQHSAPSVGAAAELLDQHVPLIKPLVETRPVPPIKNASQTSTS